MSPGVDDWVGICARHSRRIEPDANGLFDEVMETIKVSASVKQIPSLSFDLCAGVKMGGILVDPKLYSKVL
jgi:hypothetical protein